MIHRPGGPGHKVPPTVSKILAPSGDEIKIKTLSQGEGEKTIISLISL